MTVIKVINERADTDEADDALVQSLKQLSLKPNKKKPENHCPINIFRQKQLFVQVTMATRISIASESSKQKDSNKRTVSIKQVGGLEAQIKLLHEMINFAMSDSKGSVFGSLPSARGALVHGPSGCGKTLLINAVAQDSGFFVVNIETSKIWTRYYGESEANLVAQFKVARQR
jgi:AAA family ATPase